MPSDLRLFIRNAKDLDDRTMAQGRLDQLENRAWSEALSGNDRQAYLAYLKTFPPNAEPEPRYAARALRRLEEMSEGDGGNYAAP